MWTWPPLNIFFKLFGIANEDWCRMIMSVVSVDHLESARWQVKWSGQLWSHHAVTGSVTRYYAICLCWLLFIVSFSFFCFFSLPRESLYEYCLKNDCHFNYFLPTAYFIFRKQLVETASVTTVTPWRQREWWRNTAAVVACFEQRLDMFWCLHFYLILVSTVMAHYSPGYSVKMCLLRCGHEVMVVI